MKRKIYKSLLWVIIASFLLSIFYIFPELSKINIIVKFLAGFILGMLCSFLSDFIDNKFNKK